MVIALALFKFTLCEGYIMNQGNGKREEQRILFPKLLKVIDKHQARILESKAVCAKNKDHIRKFFKHCESKGLSVGRTALLSQYLAKFALWSKRRDFLKLRRQDIDEFIVELRKKNNNHSVNGYIGVLKTFYRHMNGLTSTDTAPEPVKHLQKSKVQNFIKKEELLTDEEIDRLFEQAKTIKWKAVLSVLLCGLRPSEIRSLKMSDVCFDKECLKIRVSGGKMGGKLLPRTVFVTKGVQFLQAWIISHPRRNENSAFLFSEYKKKSGRYVPLGDGELRSALYRFTTKAGIKGKKSCAYGFRHKVLTDWYTNPKLGYELARRLAGHSARSRMSEVYCHVDDQGLKDALFNSQTNKVCSRCGNINSEDSEYCCRCGFCFSTKKLAENQLSFESVKGDGLDALAYFLKNDPKKLLEMVEKWKEIQS
jgi:integrase